MDLQTFAQYIIIILFVVGVYSAYSKRSKLLCHFTGKDRTEEMKWVKMTDDHVIFRNYKFDILPDRITSFWLRSGIHFFFPTRVNFARFSWYSRWPHDPNNYNITTISPAVRRVINKEEWVRSYARGAAPQSGKKQGLLVQYLPIITLGLLVIVGFYLYQNQQVMQAAIAGMQNSLNAITK